MGRFPPRLPPDPPPSGDTRRVTVPTAADGGRATTPASADAAPAGVPTSSGAGPAGAVASADPVRPLWRGRLHLAAFAVSVPVGVALCAVAGSSSARIAAAIYS